MSLIHASSPELRHFAADLMGFAGDTLDQSQLLLRRANGLQTEWDDENYVQFADQFHDLINELNRSAQEFWAQAQWLSVFADRVQAVESEVSTSALGNGGSVNTQDSSSGKPTSPFSRITALPPVPGAPVGRNFRLLNPQLFRIEDFDWSATDPAAEFAKPYHTTVLPEDYRVLVRQVPALLAVLRAGSTSPPELDRAYHLFFGDERIHLDRRPDGRIDIVSGRHRLWAARQEGISVPVDVVSKE